MKKSDVMDELMVMEEKYCALVRYARTKPDHPRERHEECKATKQKYPQECGALDSVHSKVDQGFNLGCLAALRFAIGILERGKLENEAAFRDFPNLDT